MNAERGRPYIGPIIRARIPETMVHRIDTWAARSGLKRSEAIRALLEIALDSEGDR